MGKMLVQLNEGGSRGLAVFLAVNGLALRIRFRADRLAIYRPANSPLNAHPDMRSPRSKRLAECWGQESSVHGSLDAAPCNQRKSRLRRLNLGMELPSPH
jgi:hypothetical protein